MDEKLDVLTDEPREEEIDEQAADTPLTADADEEAELGCTVEGGLVRL